MKKFEYKIWKKLSRYGAHPQRSTADIINEFGKDGWELCGIISSVESHDNVIEGELYFKREIKEVDDIPESKLKSFVKTEMCRGCDDYNVECQIFTSTTLVKLRKVHKDNDLPWDSSR